MGHGANGSTAAEVGVRQDLGRDPCQVARANGGGSAGADGHQGSDGGAISEPVARGDGGAELGASNPRDLRESRPLVSRSGHREDQARSATGKRRPVLAEQASIAVPVL